ncbi:unnamed protein product [Prorocentrum cordatum]|uniref:Calmodulin n=1 Tax=Prorocentrum cordatum TaxID=2364126 RepID=A0ABN9RQ19_9DINO|nr:unnamed protein product [Polarella glacialis]
MAQCGAVMLTFICGAQLCHGSPGSFRGSSGGPASGRTVSAKDVESSLGASLEAVLQGSSGDAARRLSRIESAMWQTFQALPKNEMGRLAPRAVRHIVHSYFAKEHGWIINGLEPHGMSANVSEVHEVDILQDKAPAFVEALLESRRAGRGLSLGDVVAMAAALERLIFDESLSLLQVAYALNGQSAAERLGARELHEVLSSYLMIFEIGVRVNVTDVPRHRAMKDAVASAGGSWPLLVEFEQAAVHNYDFESYHRTNPFVARRYSFGEASRVVESLAQDYGKWQNTECRQMRQELEELDPDGSGRVPLRAFYSQPETADYQFHESVDYLRQIGALDEATSSVRIANYMVGPSNCIAKSTYYSVCCLSDCEGLLNELEGKIQAPAATPGRIMSEVRNLTASPDMRLPPDAAEARLRDIAGRNGGEVPLHGRLFAEFLHNAFPADCPYPHVAEDASAFAPGRWSSGRATASEEERRQHVDAAPGDWERGELGAATTTWSEEEVLPVLEAPRRARGAWSGAARSVAQAAAALAVLRIALSGWRAARGAASGAGKDKGLVLPLRV